MTDNRTTEQTATERLRALLDERGVEYETVDGWWTSWDTDGASSIGAVVYCEDLGDGLEIRWHTITPEQAIAATLGSGTCAQCAKDMGAYADSLCDPLKERVNELLRCLENDWHIRASWDGLRKFWCIELTEEGVKLRDAANGTLTAEQVIAATLGSDDDYEAKMDALLCRLTNGKWSKSRAYDLDFMEQCINEEFEMLYAKELADAELGNGTLTAEQVREAIFNGSTYASYDGAQYYANGIGMQAIADELNARAERTCEWILEHSGTLYNKWRCSECGYLHVESRCDAGATDFDPNYCPNCSAKVRNE